MPRQRNRTARIEARITPDGLRVVKRAAAQEVAHREIEESQVIRLSVEDQQRFVDLLLKPAALAPALRRAKKAHARLVSR